MPKPKKKPAAGKKKKSQPKRRPLMVLLPLGQKLRSANPLPVGRWLYRIKAIKIGRDGLLSVKRSR